MHSLFLLVSFIVAFGGRAKGGAIPLGSDDLARFLFYAFPIGTIMIALAGIYGLPLWLGLLSMALAFFASKLGHADVQGSTFTDYEGMSYNCILELMAILLPFYFTDVNIFFTITVFGFLGGVGDWLGYKMKCGLRLFGIQWCIPGDTSWGELFRYFLAFGLPIGLLGVLN